MSNPIEPNLVVVNLPVKDLEAARAWYTRVLGKEPIGEPAPDNVEFELAPNVNLMLTTGDEDAAEAGCKLMLGVADLKSARDRLTELEVEHGEVQEIEGALAWTDFRGPETHRLTLVQALG
ncbi:VOC family protein [Thermobifida cellulosilytica]|uniref:VOC domain-containing protein n=1 Tax=Thermobifida cellulosilytica TB100 TaxID=665004 RepID=A0A147KKD8_THECS|nr:VOC family protein [Thermobifida cellulosilytica]KUP97754.1 hypothetical protein AC529_04645 [Thermobifida cellulosilytica TB100]